MRFPINEVIKQHKKVTWLHSRQEFSDLIYYNQEIDKFKVQQILPINGLHERTAPSFTVPQNIFQVKKQGERMKFWIISIYNIVPLSLGVLTIVKMIIIKQRFQMY